MSTLKLDSRGKPVSVETFGSADGPHFKATVPMSPQQIAELTAESAVDMSAMPKIPYELIMRVRWYFKLVRDAWKVESFVFIHLDKETREYTMVVPGGYTAGPASVRYYPNYDRFCKNCHVAILPKSQEVDDDVTEVETCPVCGAEDSMEDSMFIAGTIHSHVDMPPFHSGVDDTHELTQSGMHFTLGHMDTGLFGAELSVVAAKSGHNDSKGNGVRHGLTDVDIISLPFDESAAQRIDFWMSRVAVDKHLTDLLATNTNLYKIMVSDAVPCFFGSEEQCNDYASNTSVDCLVVKVAPVVKVNTSRVSRSKQLHPMFESALSEDTNLDPDPCPHESVFGVKAGDPVPVDKTSSTKISNVYYSVTVDDYEMAVVTDSSLATTELDDVLSTFSTSFDSCLQEMNLDIYYKELVADFAFSTCVLKNLSNVTEKDLDRYDGCLEDLRDALGERMQEDKASIEEECAELGKKRSPAHTKEDHELVDTVSDMVSKFLLSRGGDTLESQLTVTSWLVATLASQWDDYVLGEAAFALFSTLNTQHDNNQKDTKLLWTT